MHRLRFAIETGAQPGRLLQHTCDTPACGNPDHLTDGTARGNADDRILRGRTTLRRSARGRAAATLLSALRTDFARYAPDDLPGAVHWHFHNLGLALEAIVFEQLGIPNMVRAENPDEVDEEDFDSLYA